LPSLEVAFAGVVTAVAVNLHVVLGALAVDAAKLLALLDGASARRILASVRRLHVGLLGHLKCSSLVVAFEKDASVLCQIARRVKGKKLLALLFLCALCEYLCDLCG
jgi:hypothetical protein